MSLQRKCKKCNREYNYEVSANFIVFCPHCHELEQVECEYGFGPVVPCKILLGDEVIAIVTYCSSNSRKYKYDSDKFNVHKVLKNTYIDALYEAKDITTELLK